MKTIWKYTFSLHGLQQRIPMPTGANIISVQVQDDLPTAWAIVDDEQPMVDRVFESYMTGAKVESPGRSYVGTWVLRGGSYVLHLFEVVGVVRKPKI